jgi:hypothetical protein
MVTLSAGNLVVIQMVDEVHVQYEDPMLNVVMINDWMVIPPKCYLHLGIEFHFDYLMILYYEIMMCLLMVVVGLVGEVYDDYGRLHHFHCYHYYQDVHPMKSFASEQV